MGVIIRILTMMLAYVLACAAASTILAIGALTPQWDELMSLGLPTAAVWSIVALGAVIIAVLAALPALLVIALAEGLGWRSSVVYAVLGGVLALALSYGLNFAGYIGEPGSAPARERQVLAAAGIAGGFVYWLFAGRKAGSWKW